MKIATNTYASITDDVMDIPLNPWINMSTDVTASIMFYLSIADRNRCFLINRHTYHSAQALVHQRLNHQSIETFLTWVTSHYPQFTPPIQPITTSFCHNLLRLLDELPIEQQCHLALLRESHSTSKIPMVAEYANQLAKQTSSQFEQLQANQPDIEKLMD